MLHGNWINSTPCIPTMYKYAVKAEWPMFSKPDAYPNLSDQERQAAETWGPGWKAWRRPHCRPPPPPPARPPPPCPPVSGRWRGFGRPWGQGPNVHMAPGIQVWIKKTDGTPHRSNPHASMLELDLTRGGAGSRKPTLPIIQIRKNCHLFQKYQKIKFCKKNPFFCLIGQPDFPPHFRRGSQWATWGLKNDPMCHKKITGNKVQNGWKNSKQWQEIGDYKKKH